MKRRKKPIIPVLVLIGLLGGAAVFNIKFNTNGQEHPEQKVDPQEEAANEKAATLAQNVAHSMGAKAEATPARVRGQKDPPPAPVSPVKMPHGPGATPSILKMTTGPHKPVPSPSSISSQWYPVGDQKQ